MRTGWHILLDGNSLTLSRHVPPRFDVQSQTTLPFADPERIAHQVRQDMWRALQALRGFSPVVTVETCGGGLNVTAGGRVAGRISPNVSAQILQVLEDTDNRQRWLRHACTRKQQPC